MPDITLILLGIANGLGFAGVYVLIALSFTLVLAASRVFNFALAAMVMSSIVGSYVLGVRYDLPFPVPLLIILALGMIIGALSQVITVMPFMNRGGHLTEEALVSTLGLGLAITAFAEIAFGTGVFRVPSYVSEDAVVVGGVGIRPIFIAMPVVGAVITLAFERVMSRSSLGIVLRATIEDREGANLFGINVDKVVFLAFAVAGLLAGLGGYLLAPLTGASVYVGHDLSLIAFVAMAIGGFGSFRGVIVGAVIVGLITSLTPVFISGPWTLPVLYMMLLAFLISLPRGLFGAAGHYGAGALREV